MADEITIVTGLWATKGNLVIPSRNESVRADMAGTRGEVKLQTVGTTHEALDNGDITTAGCVQLKNLDATNYVQFGRDVAATFYPTGRILPGELAVFRLDGLNLYLKANVAACDVQITQLEA